MNKHNESTARKSISIILAWLSLPILGVLLLIITTQSSTISQSLLSLGGTQDIGIATLNGLLGIILVLLLLISTTKLSAKAYFFHLRIGLWIGLGIYALILVVGIIMNSTGSFASTEQLTCTSPRDQYEKYGSAIVPIQTDLGFGTGFAVGNQTTILTAYHVVESTASITANYSAGEVKMEVIDTAPQYDLALLKIDKPTDSYFSLSDEYTAGDDAYVYGYPSNALTAGPPSLSKGIVSRVVDLASLRLTSQSAPDGLEIIQTDAAINSGNSGGPLIGSCGVIGVVSAVSDTSQLSDYVGAVSEQNIGFAVSARTAKAAFGDHLLSE